MPSPTAHPGLFAPEDSAPVSSSGWVTAHCDGGARGNPGPAGFGVVVTDDRGRLLAELSEFLGHRTNNFAEYAGLLASLQWALDHGRPPLRVVSDSELMVKQIQGRFKVKSPDLLPLWQEARRRIGQLPQFEISHALRHKNQHADRLANQAMDRGSRGGVAAGGTNPPAEASKARPQLRPATQPEAPAGAPTMLRGFTRDGSIHLLGGRTLPDGIFVKVVPE